MDAITKAIASKNEAFLKTASGDTYRIFFYYGREPVLQRLTPQDISQYRETLEPRW